MDDQPQPPAEAVAADVVVLEGLTKRFGDHLAVDGIDLRIGGGEFFSLLGPSGCGKTTTLRMIAGFEEPTDGRVLIDGVDVSRTGPERRPVNTVFQSYALFPHLTVAENVAFGLRFRSDADRTSERKRERDRKVAAALDLVRLSGLDRRLPHQLSGGQQQRVALARALVLRPRVLLLDEPLGALDAKLRKTLQVELVALQRDVGITFVYVTHDQEEALSMSDRIAVMDHGRVAQVGTPQDVYERPRTAYVADFLGVANVVEATANGDGTCSIAGAQVAAVAEPGVRGPVRVVVRPERLRIAGAHDVPTFTGQVRHVSYTGAVQHVHVAIPGDLTLQVLVANDGGDARFEVGGSVGIVWPPGAARVLSA